MYPRRHPCEVNTSAHLARECRALARNPDMLGEPGLATAAFSACRRQRRFAILRLVDYWFEYERLGDLRYQKIQNDGHLVWRARKCSNLR